MTTQEAIRIIQTEKTCVQSADYCGRDCGKCDLVMDSGEILAAYDMAVEALSAERMMQE